MEISQQQRKYVRFAYTQESLEDAINDIITGKLSLNAASVSYKIPKSTLHNKITHKVPLARQMGPSPELTKNEENKLAEWIIKKSNLGFPMHPEDVFDTIQIFLNSSKRKTKFKENRPGKKWLTLFLKRHVEVTKRNAEIISKARASVKEEDIRTWFLQLKQHLKEEDASDILNDPSRIFNADETGVQTCPKTGLILGPKNYKDTYSIACGKEKESITVLCNFSADGTDVPPYIVYPYKRIPRDVAESVPDDWSIGRSDSGWMVSTTFFAYMHIFYDWLVEKKIKFPVLLFLDGHKSHINKDMSEFCEQKQILLFALYPNSTHMLQPCDVAIFRPLKCVWKSVVRKHKQSTTKVITKQNFANLFKQAYHKAIKPSIIRSGFAKCGLYPFNPDNVDYNKCIDTRRQNFKKQQSCLNDSGNEDKRATIGVIESEIGEIMVNEFHKALLEKSSHPHPYFPLWLKCKSFIQQSASSTSPSRYRDYVSNIPKHMDDIMDAPVIIIEDQTALEHLQFPEISTDYQVNNSYSSLPSTSFEVPSYLLNINEDSLNISNFSNIVNGLDNSVILSPSETGILNSTPVEAETDASKQPIFHKKITPVPNIAIAIDGFSTLPTETIQSSIQDTSPSLEYSTISTELTPTHQGVEMSRQNSADVPSSTVNHITSTQISQPILPAIALKEHGPNADVPYENSGLENIRVQEVIALPWHTTDKPKVNQNKTDIDLSDTSRSSTPIEFFLTLPKIESKKKIIIKQENKQPYGLTGKKFKEYFRQKEEEKHKKIEQVAQRKQKTIETRKRKLMEQQKKQEGKNKKKIKLLQNVKMAEMKDRNNNKSIQNDNLSNIAIKIDCLTQYMDSYVVVKFKTDKRSRFFLGKVISVDNEHQKLKVDFYRKKSKQAGFILFTKPILPDISTVDLKEVHKVLPEPEEMRRGVISFEQKDVAHVE